MLSDLDQQRIAKDIRVIANGARLPGWIFIILVALVSGAGMCIFALKICEMLFRSLL